MKGEAVIEMLDFDDITDLNALVADQPSLQCMLIDDLMRNDPPPRTVLLCESPHVDEVSPYHRHPLAGSAGLKITRALKPHIRDCLHEYPIGCLLKKRVQHCVLKSLGLMNVSRLPLQERPYGPCIGPQYGYLLRDFKKVKERSQRGKHGLNFNTDHLNKIRDLILRDLRSRLTTLPEDVLLVPCGHFATNFLRKAECNRQWCGMLQGYNLGFVPHPVKWTETSSKIRCLVRAICRRACEANPHPAG